MDTHLSATVENVLIPQGKFFVICRNTRKEYVRKLPHTRWYPEGLNFVAVFRIHRHHGDMIRVYSRYLGPIFQGVLSLVQIDGDLFSDTEVWPLHCLPSLKRSLPAVNVHAVRKPLITRYRFKPHQIFRTPRCYISIQASRISSAIITYRWKPLTTFLKLGAALLIPKSISCPSNLRNPTNVTLTTFLMLGTALHIYHYQFAVPAWRTYLPEIYSLPSIERHGDSASRCHKSLHRQ